MFLRRRFHENSAIENIAFALYEFQGLNFDDIET